LQDHLHDVDIRTFRLAADAPLAGKSLSKVELRKKPGVPVLAIRRHSQVFHNPDPDMVILANDLLITKGSPENMVKATSLFTKQEDE
jgi:CPA2 family monovalent cation:H+ antiporter-2